MLIPSLSSSVRRCITKIKKLPKLEKKIILEIICYILLQTSKLIFFPIIFAGILASFVALVSAGFLFYVPFWYSETSSILLLILLVTPGVVIGISFIKIAIFLLRSIKGNAIAI